MLAFRRSIRQASTLALRFHSHGDPAAVLKLEEVELPPVPADGVKIKILASPLNPADFNVIQGTYGKLPALPATGGLEGAAVVEEVGSAVTEIRVGQRVIPRLPGFGMWRQHAVCAVTDVIPVSSSIPIASSATISVNPCTALRMLADFADLKQGDYVIQNGATTMVGQAVIQIAKARGIKTVNIIRGSSSRLEENRQYLTSLGADVVITDDEISSYKGRALAKELPPMKLALNCVSGKIVKEMLHFLGKKGTVVTYGGMSHEPMTIPVSPLIFKDISFRGYWMTRWVDEHTVQERQAMLKEIEAFVEAGQMSLLKESVPFQNWQQAFEKSKNSTVGTKILLTME